MKKQVIVITFNGETSNINNKSSNGIVFPASTLRRNVQDQSNSQAFNAEKCLSTNFVPIYPEIKREGTEQALLRTQIGEQKKVNGKKKEQNSSDDGENERVESNKSNMKTQKKKKNKNKTDFQIKNVLQQISSSIQSCVKDGFVKSLAENYLAALQRIGDQNRLNGYKKNITRMQFLLDNPTQYNFGCLLKMGEQIHEGLQQIFKSRILKKYIQCSKIRTLKQKSICLQAVDYLYRCFRQQEICSLHTWAHKREQKLQNKINRLKLKSQRNNGWQKIKESNKKMGVKKQEML